MDAFVPQLSMNGLVFGHCSGALLEGGDKSPETSGGRFASWAGSFREGPLAFKVNYIPGVSEISFNVDFCGHLFSVPQVLSDFLEVDFLWIVEIFHHGVAEIEVTETLTTLAAFPRVFTAWTALNRQSIIKAVL